MPTATDALVPGPRLRVAGEARGPLRGLRFAAKDLFDVAGHITGAGNPDWARTHQPASRTAPAIAHLLAAGASLDGKAICDELAYSLNGQNIHYGTPTNPAAPDRLPGGSSSGSASAVAAGLVDFALGTDTAGSVRVPASYCGLCGFRPTHGKISLEGVVPLAPSFDTVGWFARDATMLRDVGVVLLERPSVAAAPTPLLLARDAFDLLEPAAATAADRGLQRVVTHLGPATAVTIADEQGLERWSDSLRIAQAFEVWRSHGPWYEAVRPTISEDIDQRLRWTATISAEQAGAAREAARPLVDRLNALLERRAVICLPTTPGPAPLRRAPPETLAEHRSRLFALTSIASVAGLPQVSLPLCVVDGCRAPMGLSLIAPRGADLELLATACEVLAAC